MKEIKEAVMDKRFAPKIVACTRCVSIERKRREKKRKNEATKVSTGCGIHGAYVKLEGTNYCARSQQIA